MNLLSEFWKDRRSQFLTHCQVQMVNQQSFQVAWNLKVTVNWRDDGSSRPGCDFAASLMLGSDPVNTIIHFCIILSLAAQNINSGTFRGLIAAIPVVGLLILRDPFAVALQMVHELSLSSLTFVDNRGN